MTDNLHKVDDLRAVPGVPESMLDDATAASLPLEAPPAPWTVECTGITWLTRARGVRETLGSLLPEGRAAVVVGGMISYAQTPVGRYNEVFGGIGLRNKRDVSVTIPFMAVDSRDSAVGGRQNWSLPKVIAEFTGEPEARTMTASGTGWTVRVTAWPIAPRVPVKTNGRVVQYFPDGTLRSAVLRGRAKSRPAIVTVEVESSGQLASWLRPGRHLGAIMTGTTFTLPPMQ